MINRRPQSAPRLLLWILAEDREVTAAECGAQLLRIARDGVSPHSLNYITGQRYLKRLKAWGLVYRALRPARFGITERGRIAAALILAKRPDLMVQQLARQWPAPIWRAA